MFQEENNTTHPVEGKICGAEADRSNCRSPDLDYVRADGNCVHREELALDEHRQLAISNREESRVYRAVEVIGEYVEVTLLMASVFSVKLELMPRTDREEAEGVFAV